MIELILLERVEKLGQMGQLVKVKPGFARNYLLPQKKAMRATKENLAYFETQRAQLEATNLQRKGEAAEIAGKLEGLSAVIVRQAGESGQLYGSVSARDIADAVTAVGVHDRKAPGGPRPADQDPGAAPAADRAAPGGFGRRSPPMSRNRPKRRRCRHAASTRCAGARTTRTMAAPWSRRCGAGVGAGGDREPMIGWPASARSAENARSIGERVAFAPPLRG